MQTNFLWTGRQYHSLENCWIEVTTAGAVITSTIIGYCQGKIYKVDYRIMTNEHWETTLLEINSRHNDMAQFIRLEGDGKGHWKLDGKKAAAFTGCIDVDIPLTPFTNTLPIRRRGLRPQQSREIQVIYCDLLEQQITPVRQRYTCLSKTEYQYENVPNDFEATIQVDEQGLVIDYPTLFVRTAAFEMK